MRPPGPYRTNHLSARSTFGAFGRHLEEEEEEKEEEKEEDEEKEKEEEEEA